MLVLAVVSLLAACAPRSRVLPEEAVDFRAFRHVGAAPFTDNTKRGPQIAAAIEAALERIGYDPVDHKELVAILEQYKPDKQFGLGIEALEYLRGKAGADAVVFGRMSSDWSFAAITLVEIEAGNPVLHAVLRPRRGKVFATPEDVAAEFVRVFVKLK